MSLRSRSIVIPLCSLALLAATAYLWIQNRELKTSPEPDTLEGSGGFGSSRTLGHSPLRDSVAAFCGDCHTTPHADTFPKAAWEAEVERGYRFYLDAGREDLVLPPKADIVGYFRSLAPDELALPPPPDPSASAPLFVREATTPDVMAPAISHLEWSSADHEFLASDMRSGAVERYRLWQGQFASERLATLRNPARVTRCDLDGDGRMDLVAADLGSFPARDHLLGRVVWLRATEDGGVEERVLLDDIGRVADVEPADFDGDGDLDLVVAEFGWIKTGGIHLLENRGIGPGRERFSPQILDRRHGTSHVPIVDLNQDGRPDFVALISQEHEVVEAFLNSGDGTFRRETLYAAGDPAFGSSGILVVDLDQDGDLDVVLTNGDTFDSFYLKPYHAIHWLENAGRFPFTEHQLLSMPGVHRAVAADLDGDGDLDVAAVSLIPHNLMSNASARGLDSVVWLEQISSGRFMRHVIEASVCNHVTIVAGDFDEDGDVDLVTASFDESAVDLLPGLTWWRNNSPGSGR